MKKHVLFLICSAQLSVVLSSSPRRNLASTIRTLIAIHQGLCQEEIDLKNAVHNSYSIKLNAFGESGTTIIPQPKSGCGTTTPPPPPPPSHPAKTAEFSPFDLCPTNPPPKTKGGHVKKQMQRSIFVLRAKVLEKRNENNKIKFLLTTYDSRQILQ